MSFPNIILFNKVHFKMTVHKNLYNFWRLRKTIAKNNYYVRNVCLWDCLRRTTQLPLGGF